MTVVLCGYNIRGTDLLEFYIRRGVFKSVMMKYNHTLFELITAKATFYLKTDVEGRSLDTPTGLDTLAVRGDNDECHIHNILTLIYKN
jgi:hypothetical protein